MSWRGFFILISAIVYIYSFEAKIQRNDNVKNILKKNLINGTILFLFGCIVNIFLDPHAAIGSFLMTGHWHPEQYVKNLKSSNAIQMIALGLIIYSIIHYYLTRNKGYKKTSRNLAIYSVLSISVIFLTPLFNKILFSVFDITRDQIIDMNSNSVFQFIFGVFLANIIGNAQPLFPYLSVTFLGCIIGIIICQDKWTHREILLRLYLLGIGIIIIGLFDWVVLTGAEPMKTFMIAPMWFLILNSGLQTFVIALLLNLIDYTENPERKIKKIKDVRFIRRAGLMSLTLFSAQFLDIIPRLILTLVTKTDYYNYGNLSSLYQAFLLLGCVILFWIILLRIWEFGKFYGSFNWIMVYFVASLNRKKVNKKDPLSIQRNLYQVENNIASNG